MIATLFIAEIVYTPDNTMARRKGGKGNDDAGFNAFMEKSVSSTEDSMDTSKMNKFFDNPKKKSQQWFDAETEESESLGLGTGKNFMKKPKTAIEGETRMSNGFDTHLSRDSLDASDTFPSGMVATGMSIPALSLGSTTDTGAPAAAATNDYGTHGPGKETLEEIREKENFFKNFEQNADHTVDYGRLLNKMDDDGQTLGTALGTAADQQGNKMLANVALLDSLDSTFGTKAADSRDKEREMGTIPETGREDITDTARTHQTKHQEDNSQDYDEDEIDGPEESQANNTEDNTRGGGVGGTGGVGGVTLRETVHSGLYTEDATDIAAYHTALKHQAGLATLDNLGGSFLPSDSGLNGVGAAASGTGGLLNIQGTGKTTATSDNMTGQSSTAGTAGTKKTGQSPFGLKPIAPPRTPRTKAQERSIEEIIREVQNEKRPSVHFEEEDGGRGFSLSPAHHQHNTPHRQCDLSPIPKVRTSQSHGFELATPDTSTKVSESTPIASQKFARGSGKKTKKPDKYGSIKSSGYGVKSTSKSSPSKNKKASPGGHGGRTRGQRTGLGAGDSQTTISIEDVAAYVSKHMESGGGGNNKHHFSQKQWSDDEPVLSSSQKMSGLDRESAMLNEVKEWQQQWQLERQHHEKTKLELKDLNKMVFGQIEQMKLEHDKNIYELKQENIRLAAKVHVNNGEPGSAAGGNNINLKKALQEAAASGSGITEEQQKRLEKEVEEQEKLLAGYQQENERLYTELKKLQKSVKSDHDATARENQKLKAELMSLRELLSSKERVIEQLRLGAASTVYSSEHGATAILGAGRIGALESHLKQSKVRENELVKEVMSLKQTVQQKDVDIEQLNRKLVLTEQKITDSHSQQAAYAQHDRDELEKQIEQLQKKVKWYAENQQLLDRDQHLLRTKDVEISQLKDKIKYAQTESGSKAAETRQRAKDRAADAKRIQDLERQVREMEGIIRKRNPDSIPAIMWAAEKSSVPAEKPHSMQFLERRIVKLEQDLEGKDEEAARALRVLEQKYNNVKIQYEERIDSLEKQISGDPARPHSHAGALQKELDSVKERHRKKEADLQKEIEQMKKELTRLKAKESSASRTEQRTKVEQANETELRVRALQRELAACQQDNETLGRTVNNLQKEQGGNRPRSAKANNDPKKFDGGKTFKIRSGAKLGGGGEEEVVPLPAFPSSSSTDGAGKQYQPGAFTGQHVDDILREKEQLAIRVEQLELDAEHHRLDLQRLRAEHDGRERLLREEADNRVSLLRASHQKELQQLMIDHSLQHSASQVAELSSKTIAQEGIISRLREQLSLAEVDGERLTGLKKREAALEAQIRQLSDDLMQARHAHTPEMRHFESLQDKIRQMEQRHEQRERELQQMIRSNSDSARRDMSVEVSKWQRTLDAKHMETERFRSELDSILSVLRELQKQGVVLPAHSSSSASSRTNTHR